jgi:hypothetical protein
VKQSVTRGKKQEERESSLVPPVTDALPVVPTAAPATGHSLDGFSIDATSTAAEGAPLEAELQKGLGGSLGADLSGVRVHTDPRADRLARSYRANALTSGPNVFFRSDRYQPETTTGRRLIAHEVAHTVQQAAGPVSGVPAGNGVQVSQPGDAFERAADAAADRFANGEPAGLGHSFNQIKVQAASPSIGAGAVLQREQGDAGAPPAGAPPPAPVPAAAPGGAPGGAPGAASAAKPGATPPGTPPLKVGFKFDENDIQILRLRAKVLDGIKPSVLSENTFVGDVFGINVKLSKEELEPAREKVRTGIRGKIPDIKRRADRAYSDYKAEYDRRVNMGFWDRSMWDLAHTNFFGGPNAASPNPLHGDPGAKVGEMVDNVKFHLDDKLEWHLKENSFQGAVQYLESAEKGSYDAFKPLYRWREDDIKGAENTVTQLEAIKFASDVALVALGGLGGVSMAKTAGSISMGQAVATQGLLIATKVAVGDKIDWKKEGITGIVNVMVAKFGGHLGNSLAKKLAGTGATTLGEAMTNQIIAAMVVHEGSVILQTSVDYVYKTNFESGAKPATWQEFFDILLQRMLDPKGAALAVIGAAVQSAVDFKPGAAPKPPVEDPTTKNAVRDQTGVVLSKGGPESIGLARSVILEEKNFYGVRILASERGSWGTKVQGPLEEARQSIIDKMVADLKAKYPDTTIEKSGGGFVNPVVLTFRPKGQPPGAVGGTAAPPSSTQPAPPSSTQPAPPSTQPPPSSTQPAPSGGAASPQAGSVPAPAGAPDPHAAGTASANQQTPSQQEVWAQQAMGAFYDGAKMSGVPQVSGSPLNYYSNVLDAVGKLEVMMSLRPGTDSSGNVLPGPSTSTSFVTGAFPVMTQKLDSAKFKVVRDIGGVGTTGQGISNKKVLRNTETGEEWLFKPGEGEAATAHAYQGVAPGTGYLNARAASGVALGMPSIGKNMPPVTIVEFEGKVGSLQPWKQGTRSINELIREDPQLATQVLSSPEFKKFRANLDAYDFVVNSVDRNPGNVLVRLGPNNKVEEFIAIDMDLTMTPGMRIVNDRFARGAPAKISRSTYTELLGMKANEASIRSGLELVLNPALTPERRSKVDGIFQRLDVMLKGYDEQRAKNGPDSIFLD